MSWGRKDGYNPSQVYERIFLYTTLSGFIVIHSGTLENVEHLLLLKNVDLRWGWKIAQMNRVYAPECWDPGCNLDPWIYTIPTVSLDVVLDPPELWWVWSLMGPRFLALKQQDIIMSNYWDNLPSWHISVLSIWELLHGRSPPQKKTKEERN